MKIAIISFLFLITLVAPIFFYITSLNIFDNSSNKNGNNNGNYTIQANQTSSFKKEVSQLAKKSIQTIADIKNKNDLPTLEETRKRVERERQEEINRVALAWGTDPQEIEQMLYPSKSENNNNSKQKDLPTLEETRKRVERERQEEINRMALALGTNPKEVEEMILPFPLDIDSIKQETDKMVAEMNKNFEKAKIQTTQPQTPQRGDSFANVNGTFINRNELDKISIPDSFAECLSIRSVILYGTEWCKGCNEQKALFGKAFEKVWYIDCDKERQLCLDAGIKGFPTRVEKSGRQHVGKQDLNKLSLISGCPINN